MSNETLTIAPNGMLRYQYRAGGCMDFSFHTLAEVGEPYQPAFRKIIKARKLEVTYGQDTDGPVWVADFVKTSPLVQFRDENGKVTKEASGERVQVYRAAPDMLAALREAEKLILLARQYFPKSIRHSDRFTLENTCATIGSAIHKATAQE